MMQNRHRLKAYAETKIKLLTSIYYTILHGVSKKTLFAFFS